MKTHKLAPGDTIQAGDLYLSSRGVWEPAHDAVVGLMLQEGVTTEWARPQPETESDQDAPTMNVAVSWLMGRGVWDEVCDLLGINPWAVNEGLMDSAETLTLTLDQAVRLGIFSQG